MELFYTWGDPPYETVDYDISVEDALNAIVEGAIMWIPGGPVGYGLHIMNMSWGYYDFDEPEILQDNIAYAFSNGCVIVCSKGNNETDDFHLPSDITDVQVISVGGSGDDGEYDDGPPDPDLGSNFGNGIDLIAPYGYDTQIMMLDNTSNTSVIYSGGEESGTSLSAPHVSGVAALLLSYLNNPDGAPHIENLTPEDVEGILQLTATDKFTIDYDDLTGFGLLDAEAALQQVEKPHYKVQHFVHYYEHGTVPIDAEDIYLDFDKWTQLSNGLVIPYGTYLVDRYKIDETVYHTINPGAVIVDYGYWKLQSMSDVLPETFPTTVDIDFSMSTPSTTSVDVEGYFYKFKERSIDGFLVDDNVNKWIPSNIFASPLRISYTLLIYDANATDSWDSNINSTSPITVFPNPSEETVNISFESMSAQKSIIIFYDITGNKIMEKSFDVISGTNIFTLDINSLPAGIYQINLNNFDATYSKKLIKL